MVPTPIGNLLDITYRSINILKKVDFIITENIKHTLILLNHFSIVNKLLSLNTINEKKKTNQYINILKNGNNIAIVSKAGTPIINDPGYILVKYAYRNNIRVVPLPGACAAITALCAAGLKANQFCYEGFLPNKKKKCEKKIYSLRKENRTIILYESPKRLVHTIQLIKKNMGVTRKITIAREITKKWENIQKGTAEQLLLIINDDIYWKKGEITIIINGAKKNNKNIISSRILKIFNIIKKETSNTTAIKITKKICRLNKNVLYNKIIKKNIL
ncbi:Ribosomal RNA small subunit methyltransferase I [Buchnera aphidicola (Cinara kochiana kochiana)]|uniref:Ribosomal RNA small subunit methyltransferase I n=1 Tax=Buchnera aphidicola (Cinara kochiana kochiana) TaxID=2518976 RepID=A0A451D554_9GAMM|nr:16S rRNA (cytidine(1402)-2'-O)-methyltransferase [Buchnera aphidicola]VFP80980.1 Ribosomal RNA small subunit methyltransferase I [Buchnera aphidicola (Cinara kochiana kochiana)]